MKKGSRSFLNKVNELNTIIQYFISERKVPFVVD
jgi:hypothetical protein